MRFPPSSIPFQRARHARALNQPDLFARLMVPFMSKDALFRAAQPDDDELVSLSAGLAQVQPQTPAPDLVIYLQASAETLIERVRGRGVAYERDMPEEYLLRLAEAYARFFYQYEAAPLLIVNSENLNFVAQPGDFDLLLRRICAMRGPREFFSLGN